MIFLKNLFILGPYSTQKRMRVIISRLEGGASVEKCTGVAFLATFNLQGEGKKNFAVCVAV